jgi:Raf kinase inhibitor-like YbhB/YbcL family protein
MTSGSKRWWAIGVILIIASTLAGCGGSSSSKTPTVGAPTVARAAGAMATSESTPGAGASAAASIQLTSDAFADGAAIPTQFTCAGASLQPPVKWSGAPSGTTAFALLMEDTDVPGIFDHWVVYDLPANVTSLDSRPAASGDIAGGKQGQTARSGSMMYIGPCPPNGASPHHYRFRIYALDAALGLAAGAAKADVLAAMQGHVLAQGELTGLFSR